jgi:cytochrome c oxidase assembly factor CtaG
MSKASLIQAIARLNRAGRSRSNLRPVAIFCLGALLAVIGTSLGISNIASSGVAASLILAGVVLATLAVAAIMLRPDAANDN